jgi:hypothetical protein
LGRAAARSTLGQAYCDGLAGRISAFTQGNPGMPGALSLGLLVMCHGLWKAFAMKAVRARPGRLGPLSIFHSKSILYGAFVWARRALKKTAVPGPGST